ncbi:MAG: hypothetical protein JOY79_06900 [Acidobacteriaceae bacterium]|nr:hypothetical protein [Acidobacteriaceae bacterium]
MARVNSILLLDVAAKGHIVLLVAVAIAAALMFLVVCPWFDQIGHKGICYVGYGVLILALLYARGSATRKSRIHPKI